MARPAASGWWEPGRRVTSIPLAQVGAAIEYTAGFGLS